MQVIPNKVVIVDENLNKIRDLSRVTSGKTNLKEFNYDDLIEQNCEILADCLRNSGVIAKDSKLAFLGRQIFNVDVVLAEVVDNEISEFVRLVLVEDKLIKNSESKRKVLSQLLDYANEFQYKINPDELRGKIESLSKQFAVDGNDRVAGVHNREWQSKLPEWLADNWDNIQISLDGGDFLLVIAGDEIHENVVDLAENIINRRNDYMSRYELAIISLNLFESGDSKEWLFVPSVIGAVVVGERDLVINVKLEIETSADGSLYVKNKKIEMPDSVTKNSSSLVRRNKTTEQAVLETMELRDRHGAQKLLERVREMGAIVTAAGSSVSAKVRSPIYKQKFCTLFVVTNKGTLYVGFLDYWPSSANVPEDVPRNYADRLKALLGSEIFNYEASRFHAREFVDEEKAAAFLEVVYEAICALKGS